VPGGLAIKLHPCCYALQRPIAAVRALRAEHPDLVAKRVRRIGTTTPASALQPLIHDRPTTGLEGKFSLQHALAAALLDDFPDFASFSDGGVRRPEARRLVAATDVSPTPGGSGLLDGEIELELELDDGATLATALELPPGAPGRPPADAELAAKLRACAPGLLTPPLGWHDAAGRLRDP
jgi:2-methylcitrate dehydratase PrpD